MLLSEEVERGMTCEDFFIYLRASMMYAIRSALLWGMEALMLV